MTETGRVLDFSCGGEEARRPAAIVFDLDGTLYVNREFGREIARCAARYIAALKGLPEEVAAALIKETRHRLTITSGWEASLSQTCTELGGDLRELHRRFDAEIDPTPFLEEDPRVPELLRRLAARCEIYLYTNNNRGLSGRIMERIGISGLFRRVFTIEDSWRPKPDREALAMIYATIGHAPAECLFVGDRYDIDLRLPASLGSAVFCTQTLPELLALNNITLEEKI